jgi:glycosyltransferase involved in cell wall biosynthesis
MKILMCNSFYYLRAGAERCFFDLSELLSNQGHEVIPFCMENENNLPSKYSQYFISNFDFPDLLQKRTSLVTKIKVMERVLFSHESITNINRLIKDTRPDIAHIHCIGHEMSPSILFAIKRAGIPIVQTLHDYSLLCPNTNFVSHGNICEKCKIHRYFFCTLRKCKRGSFTASLLACIELSLHRMIKIYENNVNVFISPSQFLRNKYIEYGIHSPIINIPNFIDINRFQACYEPSDYFVYFGRLNIIKGIRTLIEAMKYVKSSNLYVIGEGELREPLQEFTRQNIISNVAFLGYLSTDDLIPIIRNAAFTVVPSEWYENYPMSILESFSCGKPVIASNLGAIPEIIKDGQNGLLFESGDSLQLANKIKYLLENPQELITMGHCARQQVETINNPLRHYHQIMDVYQQVLKG